MMHAFSTFSIKIAIKPLRALLSEHFQASPLLETVASDRIKAVLKRYVHQNGCDKANHDGIRLSHLLKLP